VPCVPRCPLVARRKERGNRWRRSDAPGADARENRPQTGDRSIPQEPKVVRRVKQVEVAATLPARTHGRIDRERKWVWVNGRAAHSSTCACRSGRHAVAQLGIGRFDPTAGRRAHVPSPLPSSHSMIVYARRHVQTVSSSLSIQARAHTIHSRCRARAPAHFFRPERPGRVAYSALALSRSRACPPLQCKPSMRPIHARSCARRCLCFSGTGELSQLTRRPQAMDWPRAARAQEPTHAVDAHARSFGTRSISSCIMVTPHSPLHFHSLLQPYTRPARRRLRAPIAAGWRTRDREVRPVRRLARDARTICIYKTKLYALVRQQSSLEFPFCFRATRWRTFKLLVAAHRMDM
jgi:hypothetical protein